MIFTIDIALMAIRIALMSTRIIKRLFPVKQTFLALLDDFTTTDRKTK